ncbi:DUF503 domain-containing protein [Alkalicoccus chagannorensis]|uniref:DUF503 domain-containing protein n=1 Tax=Alkalicoccus chagannorensis TaxID=427072 RepID=UPI00040BB7F3|nr:DUF503 domain-containing protein [Alkalicoccus chagannorensis]
MTIGVLTLDVHLPDAQSLKDKRAVVKSVADRIRRRFNVSFSEIDHQQVWQRAEWVAVAVSGSRIHAEKELQSVLKLLDQEPFLEVMNVQWEWL